MGRDPSPVLDRYPPKDPSLTLRAPPPSAPRVPPPPTPGPSPDGSHLPPSGVPPEPARTGPGPSSSHLITLDRPFDLDAFAALLGATSIRVTVPREALPEVLHRVTEFMGFGIYVYSISVRPAPGELMKSFVVELQRVDYSAEKGAWVPFVERGTGDSPYAGSDARP